MNTNPNLTFSVENYLDEHEKRSLLRLITCGSVDDGKSTLIGHLLHDTKRLFEDQIRDLRRDSVKYGTTGAGQIDYALLLDGLKAEREQGITIDVAYRYFSTPKRKFIIADCPGHEQYTRNMATGASTAECAVILIDARHGIVTQTKRHAHIVSLLGIEHIVVAVNKMDLVDFDETVFRRIESEFSAFLRELSVHDARFIPLSALDGDNLIAPSERTPWYSGETLLETLENLEVSGRVTANPFRLPVQAVIRPDLSFRGFAGSVASGLIHTGDEIVVLPSGKRSAVKSILTPGGKAEFAFAPQAVTIELADEIDISPGDVIVTEDFAPRAVQDFRATLIHLHESPLRAGLVCELIHSGRSVKAQVLEVEHLIDVNTLEKRPGSQLELNAIASVRFHVLSPVFPDIYARNRSNGAFVLIDPLSNATLSAGIFPENFELPALRHHADAVVSIHSDSPTLRSAIAEFLRGSPFGNLRILEG